MLQQFLNLGNPVSSHPLNCGRVAWLLAVPNWMGGGKWVDLTGHSSGTITNPSGSTGWRTSQRRPGGFGSMLINGTGSTANGISFPLVQPTVYTAAMWVYLIASSQLTSLVIGSNDTGANAGHLINQRPGITPFGLQINSGTFSSQRGNTVPSTGVWYHVAVTYAGSSAGQVKIYLNGNDDSGTATAVAATSGGSQSFVGMVAAFSGIQGYTDDIGVWNRVMSAAEILSLYNQSRRGYPEALNWIRTPGMLAKPPAAGGVFFRRTLYRRVGSRGVAA